MGTAALAESETPDNDTIVVWSPQPGPQTALITCPVFEVFYGGARGGGKTDGMLGEFINHADLYGADATGLMVRRERTQLIETIERSKEFYGLLGARFHEQDKMWRFPNGARLRFAYLERDADAEGYQGHSYCVAVGTRIRMADGSLKPIELICASEMVATLEGPRRVSSVTPPYVAPCVSGVVRDDSGLEIGRQTHPVWHPVLTTDGLISSQSPHGRQSGGQPPSSLSSGDIPDQEFDACAYRVSRGWRAWGGYDQSGCKGSPERHQGVERLQPLTVHVVLHGPSVLSEGGRFHGSRTEPILCRSSDRWFGWLSGLYRYCRDLLSGQARPVGQFLSGAGHLNPYRPNALASALNGSCEGQGSLSGYLSGLGSRDERAPETRGTGQGGLPSLSGVGNKFLGMLWGVLGTTRPHTRSASIRWVHPYSGEARYLSEEVTSGTLELQPCGDALVADLTVDGANHYISESGLINKNTRVYVEELGNFPTPKPVMKLMATLRSPKGVPVGFRATGNPGGPGHSWVKTRYIDPAPGGWERLIDERSGLERIYIPSRIADNTYLGEDYIQRLRQSGSDELVKAWLEGDWSAIEGAFFDCWSTEKHVVAPFEIPAHWARFRSMDWGSAAPFSVGWWAIATETVSGELLGEQNRGRTIPRGCIIRYREWYGEGQKLTAEEVAEGIVERERAAGEESDSNKAREGKPHIAYGVLDPSAFSQDGGPSIAERMAKVGAFFRRADNKRVPAAGAQGGWDQMRQRMKGDADGRPMMVVFNTCRDFIRTVPILQHDTNRPEDLDTEAEDHAADEARYACMSRPYIREAPAERKPVHTFEGQPDGSVRSNLTVHELIKRNAKLRRERNR
jgi:hypothetical protein